MKSEDPRQEIRHQMRQMRLRMEPTRKAAADESICQLLDQNWQEEWKRVLIYVSRPEEVSTHPFIRERIQLPGCEIYVPSFQSSTGNYQPSRLLDFDLDLTQGKFHILEPRPECTRPLIDPLDVMIIPGLAFDLQGNRLGYGYGYFDAMSRHSPALKIGLAYPFQILENLPVHGGDVPMDIIVTEEGWNICRKP